MQTVRSSWKTYFRVMLILDAVLFAATIVYYTLYLMKGSYNLYVWTIVFAINSAIWFMFVAVCFVRSAYESDKLKCLKINSIRYDGKVERIIRNHSWIRIGSMMSCYAQCSYRDNEGKNCLVKSDSFLLDNLNNLNGNYSVSVYVSHDNPAEYAVELGADAKTSGQFDFDYRYQENLYVSYEIKR